MTRLSTNILCVTMLTCLVGYGAIARGADASSPAAGTAPPAPEARPYRKQWALLIGIDYADRQQQLVDLSDRVALVPLRNAAHDAEAFAELLEKLYGYRRGEELRVLRDKEATYDAIETALGNLCDPKKVAPEDSVLLFFAGHGVRLDSETDRAALLAYDVQLSRGKPTAKYIPLHSYLFARLQQSPARHKLVVLDSCYSGEIFQNGFQPRSETDDRSDRRLQAEAAFQAIASCRAAQVSADGTEQNSPFTAALLDGLRRLPAQDNIDRRVWANRLLAHIRPKFLGTEQKPDCRSLIGDEGEFCFYPGNQDLFASYKVSASEQTLLMAMAGGRQGDWWFHEIPWFIPGVRERVVEALDATPSRDRGDLAHFIEPATLQAAATKAFEGYQPKSELERLRMAHFTSLVATKGTKKFHDALQTIVSDLQAHEAELENCDRHLLAIALHAVGDKEEARIQYEQAIEGYATDPVAKQTSVQRILTALCRADMGQLLLEQFDEPAEAAVQFRRADDAIRELSTKETLSAAGVFRIFALCREAEAWLRLNRWAEADERLLTARDLATNLAARDYLTAFVYRQMAWSHLVQWKLKDAQCAFFKSNEILKELFHGGYAHELAQDVLADSKPAQGLAKPSAVPTHGNAGFCIREDEAFAGDPTFRNSTNYSAKIAYFHNLHGLAMTARFRGDVRDAAERYRQICAYLEEASAGGALTDGNIEQQLILRAVNSQERLADCNLFGDPAQRDVAEAVDDYRRALAGVHRLEPNLRDRWAASLSYKLAWALALPSSVQDKDLAGELCRRADQIFETQKELATGQYWSLGRLGTRLAAVLATPPGEHALATSDALTALRTALNDYRDVLGSTPHRDQLEIALFASRALLAANSGEYRQLVADDVDLLLSFCRMALVRSRDGGGGEPSNRAGSESLRYLRPYYDAAMRARLKAFPTQVKGLLEIQWEATQGSRYIKPRTALPTLAMFVLDGNGYLLCDCPEEAGICLDLSQLYDLPTLRKAMAAASAERLPLPRQTEELLSVWCRRKNSQKRPANVRLLWKDPLYGFAAPENASAASAPGPWVGFPFRLPEYVNSQQEFSTAHNVPPSSGSADEQGSNRPK